MITQDYDTTYPDPSSDEQDAGDSINESESKEEAEGDLLAIRVGDDLGEPDAEDKDLPPTDPQLPKEDEDKVDSE
jgi:hypothetical protein